MPEIHRRINESLASTLHVSPPTAIEKVTAWVEHDDLRNQTAIRVTVKLLSFPDEMYFAQYIDDFMWGAPPEDFIHDDDMDMDCDTNIRDDLPF